MTNETYKEKQIALLYEVIQALTSSLDLRESLEAILELLSRLMKMNRGTVTLLEYPLKQKKPLRPHTW